MEKYIYEASADDKARFVIGTEGKNPLIVMSINPSIGTPTITTPTLGTVRHIAADYGYDSWIVLCLYPQRATHLNELDEMASQSLIDKNNEVIDKVLSKFPNHKIWAAWGTHYKARWYFPQCLQDIVKIADKYHDTWMHYGPLDEGGLPQYCLYLDNGEGWFLYDVNALLQKAF